jgi:hypothetical protein
VKAASDAIDKRGEPSWSQTHVTATNKDEKAARNTTPSGSGGGGSGTGSSGGGGGGNGGGRGGNGGRGGGGGGNDGNAVYQEARRRLHLMMQPYMMQLRQNIRSERQDTNKENSAIGNIGTALQGSLSALVDPYQQQMAGVQSDLTGNLNALMPTMQDQVGGAPQTEQAAAMGVVGSIGAGQQGILAGQRATELGYNTSAQRQGAEEVAINQKNNLSDFFDTKSNIRDQMAQLKSQAPAQLDQLIQEIEQRNLNNKLGLGQLAISRGNLGVAQGGLNLQREALNLDAAQQAAVMNLLQDPDFAAWLAQNPGYAALLGG